MGVAMVARRLAPLLLLGSVRAEFRCGDPWPDFCNGSHVDGCSAYAPPPAPGADWPEVRRRLVRELFGEGGLPTKRRKPDFVVPERHEQVFGNCECALQGTCSRGDCTGPTNLTRLVWTLSVPVNASYEVVLNATAFHSLNTSGLAPNNEGVQWPPEPEPARDIGDTLVIYHSGHEKPCRACEPDKDGTVDWLNRMGYDTLTLMMPLFQCNFAPSVGRCDHAWFRQFADRGAKVFRFFLEPVILAVNYALDLGYEHVVLTGLSGGGWTTTMAAAIDPRIRLSVPVAGSIPCDFRHTSWDWEQLCDHSWARVANYTSLYVLAALEEQRFSLQVLHQADPCCFHACHRHERILDYNDFVRSQARGGFATAATAGNLHEVNERDRALLAWHVEKLRRGQLRREDFAAPLPFSLLNPREKSQPVLEV